MRETRSSGSVEGVMGNHDSYSDFGSGTVDLPVRMQAPAQRTDAQWTGLNVS